MAESIHQRGPPTRASVRAVSAVLNLWRRWSRLFHGPKPLPRSKRPLQNALHGWRRLYDVVSGNTDDGVGYIQFYVEQNPTWIPDVVVGLEEIGATAAAAIVRHADALAATHREAIEEARRDDDKLLELYPRAEELWDQGTKLEEVAEETFAAFARYQQTHPEAFDPGETITFPLPGR